MFVLGWQCQCEPYLPFSGGTTNVPWGKMKSPHVIFRKRILNLGKEYHYLYFTSGVCNLFPTPADFTGAKIVRVNQSFKNKHWCWTGVLDVGLADKRAFFRRSTTS